MSDRTPNLDASTALASSPEPGARRRVVVAMSGGVDSSVVAALMQQAGHEVIGITLQLYDHGAATGRKGSCCAGQDIHDARRVADAIGIPHYVLDYERRFASAVIDSFAESYAAGETPIPCVTCNQQIKFKDLLDTAKDLGADVLATGHYIQRREGPNGPELLRAVDPDRDQSYFLFATTAQQLSHLWFPLGGMPKARVRELAHEFGLPVAEKADSQDICFVPTGRYTGVIERLKPGALKPGDIVHIDGRRLGTHEGIVNYTIGQRKGLKIPGPEPLYVVRLDAERNEVVVGPRDCLRTKSLLLRNTNWLGDEPFEVAAGEGLPIFARIRSSQAPQAATLFAEADATATVVLEDGEDGVAAGQACVFYASGADDARLLGGGFIARTIARQPGAFTASESRSAEKSAGLRGAGPGTREIDVAN
ncbi:tRNA 2-thiouridine(34) synthase MnmA [Hyphomicrobium sp. 1Nfss2.1]|uniref:tRNA 2-thiouridine(34) synthase MnmA n=1 Tax=Hyphomicrobium sp. 1Nfss2.1 TaxID=3413936 RepID=UPI003C7AD8EA